MYLELVFVRILISVDVNWCDGCSTEVRAYVTVIIYSELEERHTPRNIPLPGKTRAYQERDFFEAWRDTQAAGNHRRACSQDKSLLLDVLCTYASAQNGCSARFHNIQCDALHYASNKLCCCQPQPSPREIEPRSLAQVVRIWLTLPFIRKLRVTWITLSLACPVEPQTTKHKRLRVTSQRPSWSDKNWKTLKDSRRTALSHKNTKRFSGGVQIQAPSPIRFVCEGVKGNPTPHIPIAPFIYPYFCKRLKKLELLWDFGGISDKVLFF